MSNQPRFVVVGGGLAGLGAAMEAAEAGAAVDLISIVPVKRSHSVCAQGGINGAVDTMGEGDSTWEHFDDTVYGGDFLANQPPVQRMCEAAPAIIYMFDRMGVPFNRTREGLLDFRRFGGTKHRRTAFAGATTGQQLLYALDEQVRRFEAEGKVRKFEGYQVLSPILDDAGRCRGVTMIDLKTMEVTALQADAVVYATGGIGAIYGQGTNSIINTGSSLAGCFRKGAAYANPEFVQIHPTGITGEDKLRLMSESARGEGGRVWVPKTAGDSRDGKTIPEEERFYFLEEWYPAYGNLVPRDIAARAIHKVVHDEGLGVRGEAVVYLDLSHLPTEFLNRRLGGIMEIYRKFKGVDPRENPMEVFPALHYTMGGFWTDFNQRTNIPGMLAAGECGYQYHGANRLGANALLACTYAGMVAAPAAMAYAEDNADLPSAESACSAAVSEEKSRLQEMMDVQGDENPYELRKEMGKLMVANCTIIRENDKLASTLEDLRAMRERMAYAPVPDKSPWSNLALIQTKEMHDMLILAETIVAGAHARDESRGAHYKPAFPERDDENWLKTTKAFWKDDAPALEFESVDTSLIPPRKRVYDTDKTTSEKKED